MIFYPTWVYWFILSEKYKLFELKHCRTERVFVIALQNVQNIYQPRVKSRCLEWIACLFMLQKDEIYCIPVNKTEEYLHQIKESVRAQPCTPPHGIPCSSPDGAWGTITVGYGSQFRWVNSLNEYKFWPMLDLANLQHHQLLKRTIT